MSEKSNIDRLAELIADGPVELAMHDAKKLARHLCSFGVVLPESFVANCTTANGNTVHLGDLVILDNGIPGFYVNYEMLLCRKDEFGDTRFYKTNDPHEEGRRYEGKQLLFYRFGRLKYHEHKGVFPRSWSCSTERENYSEKVTDLVNEIIRLREAP